MDLEFLVKFNPRPEDKMSIKEQQIANSSTCGMKDTYRDYSNVQVPQAHMDYDVQAMAEGDPKKGAGHLVIWRGWDSDAQEVCWLFNKATQSFECGAYGTKACVQAWTERLERYCSL